MSEVHLYGGALIDIGGELLLVHGLDPGTGVPRSYETAPPPWDHHMTLGIVLPEGPRWGGVLMSEVSLYRNNTASLLTPVSFSKRLLDLLMCGIPQRKC